MQRAYSTRSEVRLWLVVGVCGRNLFSPITGKNSHQMKNKSDEKKVISSFFGHKLAAVGSLSLSATAQC